MKAPRVGAAKGEGLYFLTSIGSLDSSSRVMSPSPSPFGASSAAAFSSNRRDVGIAGSGDACRRS
jgi:hypothetical protein